MTLRTRASSLLLTIAIYAVVIVLFGYEWAAKEPLIAGAVFCMLLVLVKAFGEDPHKTDTTRRKK